MTLRNDHDRGVWVELPDLLADPVAVLTLQGGLEDHQVNDRRVQNVKRRFGISRRVYAVALLPQEEGQQLELERVLVQCQHASHRSFPSRPIMSAPTYLAAGAVLGYEKRESPKPLPLGCTDQALPSRRWPNSNRWPRIVNKS